MPAPRTLHPILAVLMAAAACSAAPAGPSEDNTTAVTSSGAASEPTSGTGTSGSSVTGGMAGPDDALRITDITMRCTHNSYHIEPAEPFDDSHRYTQAPLDVQLGEQGVRAFELDVHAGAGYPVQHIPFGIDDLSTCPDLGACLGVINAWSAANAEHHLLVVWIEIKDELDGVTIEDYDAFDAVIRGALPPERLYEPDEFKRGRATMREALLAEGWPTIGETRGQVMLVLLDGLRGAAPGPVPGDRSPGFGRVSAPAPRPRCCADSTTRIRLECSSIGRARGSGGDCIRGDGACWCDWARNA